MTSRQLVGDPKEIRLKIGLIEMSKGKWDWFLILMVERNKVRVKSQDTWEDFVMKFEGQKEDQKDYIIQ